MANGIDYELEQPFLEMEGAGEGKCAGGVGSILVVTGHCRRVSWMM